jgi:hypothetical protein
MEAPAMDEREQLRRRAAQLLALASRTDDEAIRNRILDLAREFACEAERLERGGKHL